MCVLSGQCFVLQFVVCTCNSIISCAFAQLLPTGLHIMEMPSEPTSFPFIAPSFYTIRLDNNVNETTLARMCCRLDVSHRTNHNSNGDSLVLMHLTCDEADAIGYIFYDHKRTSSSSLLSLRTNARA